MSVYRDRGRGPIQWRYRQQITLPTGELVRISGTPLINTKAHAQDALRAHIERTLNPIQSKPASMTFEKWFNGRFWKEWVIANKNKHSETEAKESIYRTHLGPFFGPMPLDEIDSGAVSRFKAMLVSRGEKEGERKLSEKRINNILAVLSKALHYAEQVELIERVPRIGVLRTERPEIVAWEIEEYARILAAARAEGLEWYVAACLAGEAGLRIGEVRALRWVEDVDLVAGTITVNQQTRKGHTGTPKGRTRRTIPMTSALLDAIKSLSVVRAGLVVRNLDGTEITDGQTTHTTYRICRRAGLPPRGWHVLRHSFGSHLALFGVNPWRLQKWMGHKRIDETMRYVHFAEDHVRPLPDSILVAGDQHRDPDQRVLGMLGTRALLGNAEYASPLSKTLAF